MKDTMGDRIMMICIYTFLTVLAVSTLYPFLNAVAVSFNQGLDTSKGGVTLWPRVFTLENYKVVFKDDRLMNGFVISILRTIIGTASAILCTAIFSYGMSKKELMGRNFYMVMCIITLYFAGGLIPSFMLIRNIGLMDSFWVFIIPSLIGVWNMIIFRTFFQGLPVGLEESAKIDGCGNWGTLFRIVFPLSGPVIATLALFTAIYHWNEWFYAGIYISDQSKYPIQTMLRQILLSNIVSDQAGGLDASSLAHLQRAKTVTSKSLSMATMLVATLPIICVYPFVQKYFVKGVLVGSLKE